MGRGRSRSGSRLDFPVVGVGASAGGLEALQKLFGALPDETGMAFVVVVHLSPEHQSHMAELIARTTALPVSEVTEDTPVEPDHVSVLIDKEFRIHFFHGDTDPFLQQPRGVPTLDLLRIARRGFAARLQTAVARALLEQRPVTLNAAVEAGSGYPPTRIRVAPLEGGRSDDPVRLLVSFLAPADAAAAAGPDAAPERRAESGPGSELEDALRASREEARATLERLEASNEELRASNEEVASINEELRSSNEELETSKEELQSLNEELNTVNAQLQSKVEELEDRTNDLDSLLRSSAIATIALDRSLQIRWFTPAVSELFDIIQGDIGRPLAHFARKFADGDLIEHAQAVLRTLTPDESEVMSDSGMWFMRRILPYRASDDRIDGVVVTFTDITQRKQAEMSLRESEERFKSAGSATSRPIRHVAGISS